MKWDTVAYLFSALAHKYPFLALGSILIVQGKSVNSRAAISLIFSNTMNSDKTFMHAGKHLHFLFTVSSPACLQNADVAMRQSV